MKRAETPNQSEYERHIEQRNAFLKRMQEVEQGLLGGDVKRKVVKKTIDHKGLERLKSEIATSVSSYVARMVVADENQPNQVTWDHNYQQKTSKTNKKTVGDDDVFKPYVGKNGLDPYSSTTIEAPVNDSRVRRFVPSETTEHNKYLQRNHMRGSFHALSRQERARISSEDGVLNRGRAFDRKQTANSRQNSSTEMSDLSTLTKNIRRSNALHESQAQSNFYDNETGKRKTKTGFQTALKPMKKQRIPKEIQEYGEAVAEKFIRKHMGTKTRNENDWSATKDLSVTERMQLRNSKIKGLGKKTKSDLQTKRNNILSRQFHNVRRAIQKFTATDSSEKNNNKRISHKVGVPMTLDRNYKYHNDSEDSGLNFDEFDRNQETRLKPLTKRSRSDPSAKTVSKQKLSKSRDKSPMKSGIVKSKVEIKKAVNIWEEPSKDKRSKTLPRSNVKEKSPTRKFNKDKSPVKATKTNGKRQNSPEKIRKSDQKREKSPLKVRNASREKKKAGKSRQVNGEISIDEYFGKSALFYKISKILYLYFLTFFIFVFLVSRQNRFMENSSIFDEESNSTIKLIRATNNREEPLPVFYKIDLKIENHYL